MVSGKLPTPADDIGAIRLLNQPQPLMVTADGNGLPRWVGSGGASQRVSGIGDSWRVDDEWWRTSISRRYFVVTLEDGAIRTIFQDLIGDGWYEQTY